MQDWTPYARLPVGDIPEFMSLDNSINRDILHSLRMYSVLSCYILDGEETDEEESNMFFRYSTPREIAQGLKRIWYSWMWGTPSSYIIIKYVDLSLKSLEIVYRENGAAVEGLADRNVHRRKEEGKGESVSWGVALTKGEFRECKLTKKMFTHNYLLQLCLKKNGRFLSYSLTPLFFMILKTVLRTNEIKR